MLKQTLTRVKWLNLISILVVFSGIILLHSLREDNVELVVGTSADNPPFEFSSAGTLRGFDIDLINAISNEIGEEIKIKNMDFEGLLPSLFSGHIDLIIAALSNTEERRKQVDFSTDYASTNVAVLTSKEDFNNIYELKNDTIGVQLGTTWQDVARELQAKMPNIKIKSMGDNLMLLEELKSRRIDAIILEESQAKSFQELNPELNKIILEEYSSDFAIAFKKNFKYKKKINKAILKLKKNGTIDKLKHKWFQ